jgi:hypothetical protein
MRRHAGWLWSAIDSMSVPGSGRCSTSTLGKPVEFGRLLTATGNVLHGRLVKRPEDGGTDLF